MRPHHGVWLDLTQIKVRYGDRAHTVLNNHRATPVLAGVKDSATLDHVSRLGGDTETTRPSTTTDSTGRRSTTEGVQYRRLAPDHGPPVAPRGSPPPASNTSGTIEGLEVFDGSVR